MNYEIKKNLYHLYDYEKDDACPFQSDLDDNEPYVFINEPNDNYSFEHTMYHFYNLQKQIINNQFIKTNII